MTFFPLGDNNPRILVERPWMTWLIAISCTLFYCWEVVLNQTGQEGRILEFAIIPALITGEAVPSGAAFSVPAWATLVTSLFLHVDMVHLIVNMLFLLVFGDNIEDSTGHLRFVVFYLVCGVGAGLVHVLAMPGSLTPTLGASGAISGILGGYLLLHPRAKVWFFPSPFAVPAWVLLIFWAGIQFYAAASEGWSGAGVAWGAHIGGFLIGLALIIPMRRKTVPLFGVTDVPSGVTMKDRKQRTP